MTTGGAGAGGMTTGGSGGGNPPDGGPPDSAGETPPALTGTMAVGSACPVGQSHGDPLPANPVVTMVKGGFTVTEGPVWVAAQKALYFSEFEDANGRIHKYTPADGKFIVLANNVGVNGLALDPQGMLVAASQDMRRLTRFDITTGARSPVPGSDSYMNRPFNAVNDVIVRLDGHMYFTDPTFINLGRPGQGTTAYYHLSTAGQVTRIGTGPQPNSLGISPDGKWLYVTSSGESNARVWRHPLNADGGVGERTEFLSVRSESLAIDCAGNLYLSAAGRITAYTAAGTMIRSFANIPAGITNMAIGGEDAKTLFITARAALYQTPLNVPGLPN
jgi:gluconolactonase